MSDAKNKSGKIVLGGIEFDLIFTINVIDDLQDKFDISIEQLGDIMSGRDKFKAIRYILTELINEGIDNSNYISGDKVPHVTERQVGRWLNVNNIGMASECIFAAFTAGVPDGSDDEDEDDTANPQTAAEMPQN